MAGRSKILLLEGDQSVAMSVASAIREIDCDFLLAGDAISALTVARNAKPDLVVLSGNLPGGGGLVALKRIRNCVHTAVIPIIALSAGSQKQQLLAAGAQECLDKPVDLEQLRSAMKKHLAGEMAVTEAPAETVRDPERVAELKDTGLLDSAPEKTFDRLTLLASKLLGTPVALMSLVDKNRQFFKSQTGLGEPWATKRQTPLSHSFCQWVVAGNEHLAVSDAREHPVLRNNLAVQNLGVIAYAGVPLSAGRNKAIGSFCAVDSKPRPWSEEDLEVLRDLAEIVEAHVIIRRAIGAPIEGLAATISVPTPAKLMEAAAKAVAGATRILGREGLRLGKAARDELQDIVTTQTQQLLGLAGHAR